MVKTVYLCNMVFGCVYEEKEFFSESTWLRKLVSEEMRGRVRDLSLGSSHQKNDSIGEEELPVAAAAKRRCQWRSQGNI